MMTTVLKLVAQPAFRSLTINSCLALALTLGTQSIRANDQTRADDSLERLIAAADSDPTKADFAAIWSAAVTRYKVRDITEVKVLLSEWDARALGPDIGAQCKYQIDRLESARQKFYFSLALQKRSLECAEQTGDATRAAAREALIAALLKYFLKDGSGQSWRHPIAQVVHQDADALADLAGLELMSRLYNMRDNGEMRLMMRLRAPEQPEKTWYFDPLQLPLAMARAQGRTVADYPGYTLHLIARLQGEQLSHGDPGGLVTYARSLQPSTLEAAKEALAVWQSVRSLSPADGVVGMTELCLWKAELDCLGAAIDGLLDLAPQANSEVLATLAALNHRGVGMKRDKKAGEALLNKAMQQGDRGDVLNQYANVLGINTLWQMGAEGGLIQITTPSRARRDALAALSRAADAGNATAMVMSVTLAGKDGSVHAYRKALDKLETTNASDDPTILFFFAMNNAFFPTSEPDYGIKLQESMRRALDAGVGAAGLALYSFSKDPALNLTLEHPAIHYLRQGARLGDSESIKTLLDESPEMPIGEAVNWLYGLMLRSEEGALGDLLRALRSADQVDPVILSDTALVAEAMQETGEIDFSEELRWFRLRWSKDPKARDAALAELLEHHSEQPNFWYDLGRQFEFGSSRLPTDFATAARYYEIGAKAGSADAMTFYAYALRHGRGVDQNLHEALHWLEKAVQTGEMEAINNLAWMRCTITDTTIRDGNAGLAVIQRIKPETRAPGHWDTEAACLAASGRFEEAVAAQQKAAAACSDAARKDGSCRYSKRLAVYQQGQAVEIAPSDNDLAAESQ